jgi:hypothetical protein
MNKRRNEGAPDRILGRRTQSCALTQAFGSAPGPEAPVPAVQGANVCSGGSEVVQDLPGRWPWTCHLNNKC